jgi:hypothetical protein
MVPAVNEGDFNRRVGKRPRGGKTGEAATYNHQSPGFVHRFLPSG